MVKVVDTDAISRPFRDKIFTITELDHDEWVKIYFFPPEYHIEFCERYGWTSYLDSGFEIRERHLTLYMSVNDIDYHLRKEDGI